MRIIRAVSIYVKETVSANWEAALGGATSWLEGRSPGSLVDLRKPSVIESQRVGYR